VRKEARMEFRILNAEGKGGGEYSSEPHSVAFLPFVGTVFNRMSRVLALHYFKSVGLCHIKLSSLLRPVKDHLRLRTPRVYRIPCECGRV
jgi:hypothetical protein